MSANLQNLRDQLAKLRGLGEAFYDHRGELRYFSPRSRNAILRAMHVDIDDVNALQAAIDHANAIAAQIDSTPVEHEGCFEPDGLQTHKRWGLSIQLYTLRSSSNWGMGDFADLKQLIELAAPLGCDVVGLNPLHALLPSDPSHISPYSPSSRLFLNPLYVAIADVPEFAACRELQTWLAQVKTQNELAELRAADEVQYVRVANLKFHALRLLHKTFVAEHLRQNTPRAAAFAVFIREGGDALKSHALFDALDAHFRRTQSAGAWQEWPSEFRDPASSAVATFAATHADEVDYFVYLQWLASEQLGNAQQFAHEQGMHIGLYADLAVGSNRSGSEVWANQSLYVTSASIGAPPDPLALSGQDWGIPPIDPSSLQAQQLKPFAELLRANMRHVGALRIDHVMSLFRLWWVPQSSGENFSAAEGVYVHYPLQAIAQTLAHESIQARCLVIGEDLGTVPDEIREAMARHRLYHYNVLLFEKRGEGVFKSPSEYPRCAVATATTHDLPPLRAWWQSADIDLREALGVYPQSDTADQLRAERNHDRRALLHALNAVDVWHWRDGEPIPPFSSALARAIHLYLGFSEAALVLVQLEDLMGMTSPVNVPGTHSEHANWQRKLDQSTQEIFKRIEVREILTALTKARAGIDPNK